MLSELLLNRPAFHIASCDLLRMVQATDCHSLYDVLVSENPRTEDKRTIVTIRSAQQFLSRDNVFWIPTALQFADGLTKVSMTLMATFYQWLQRPWIQLHECDRNVKQQSNPSVKSPQHLQRMTWHSCLLRVSGAISWPSDLQWPLELRFFAKKAASFALSAMLHICI